MSSLTIITVAVDRHRVITRSHKKQVSSLFAIMLLPLISLLSCLLASPVFIRSHLTSLDTIVASNLHMPLPTHMQDRLEGILVCVEDWRGVGEGKPLRKEHRT